MPKARNELSRQKRAAGIISVLWLGALAAIFAWQAVYYRGLVAALAEWQYRVLGHYYPGITFLLLCLFFSLPLVVMLLILWRRWKRKAREAGDPRSELVGFSHRFQRLCTVTALIAAGVGLGSLVLAFLQPGDSGVTRIVDATDLRPLTIAEGRTTIHGPVDLDAVVQFDQRALFIHRRLHFAPVRSAADDAPPARLFVEVREMAHLATPFVPVMTGVLKQDSLPGDVRRLYHNIQYPVAEQTYLLYQNAARLRWRYYMVAAQLGIVTLLFGLAAWAEKRRRSRIERRANAPVSG